MKHTILFLACTLTAAPTLAEQVFNENVIVDGGLCVGLNCVTGESFSNGFLKLKSTDNRIHFDDRSTSPAQHDWELRANEPGGSMGNLFAISDLTAATTPFTLSGDASHNALYVHEFGVGLGTSLPLAELHIARPFPTLMFEKTGTSPYTWNLQADSFGFLFHDVSGSATPVRFQAGAPENSINLAPDGDIGLGTFTPEGKLHTKGDGVQLAYFESGDGDAVQVRFRTDSENRRFLAVDNDNNVKTQMQFQDNEILFLGQTVAQEWLRVSAAGITTAGPTCNPNPCDRTFDREFFEVPSIEDRAAYMWENMHLPAIGPTSPEVPFNVTEKLGGVIHELEVAHIYIEKLHARLEAQEVEKLAVEARFVAQEELYNALLARLAALEGLSADE